MSLSREERLGLIERGVSELALCIQADLLSISRSSLYYKPKSPAPEEIALRHRIDEIYTRWPFYGSRRISVELSREGWEVNRKHVQRCMREMGIAGICPGPNLSRRNQEHNVYPYLLRGIEIGAPNQVWGIDITYIRMQAGWMYLVAVLDWYSRYIVSWELDQTIEIGFVLTAVDHALSQAVPIFWNSDQGSHFTSPLYLGRLEDRGVQISMDGKGRAIDNIFTERLWRSVKYEEVYLNSYDCPRTARVRLGDYIKFYNEQRPHQSLSYQTPAEVYHRSW